MTKKPADYWRERKNIVPILEEAMADNHGLIPPRSYFLRRGLSSLFWALRAYHGGVDRARARLGVAEKKYCPCCGRVLETTEFRTRAKCGEQRFLDNICKGCHSAEVAKYRNTDLGRAATIVRGAKHRAKTEGMECDLTKEWVIERLEKIAWRCEVTCLPMKHHGSLHSFASPLVVSIDRIDSARGYTQDNVQFVVNWANWAKKISLYGGIPPLGSGGRYAP